jgi:hypothetical protein
MQRRIGDLLMTGLLIVLPRWGAAVIAVRVRAGTDLPPGSECDWRPPIGWDCGGPAAGPDWVVGRVTGLGSTEPTDSRPGGEVLNRSARRAS